MEMEVESFVGKNPFETYPKLRRLESVSFEEAYVEKMRLFVVRDADSKEPMGIIGSQLSKQGNGEVTGSLLIHSMLDQYASVRYRIIPFQRMLVELHKEEPSITCIHEYVPLGNKQVENNIMQQLSMLDFKKHGAPVPAENAMH